VQLHMSKAVLSAILFFVGAYGAHAQQPPPAPTQPAHPIVSWFDHLRISTVSIGVVKEDEQTKKKFFFVIGTGVFVAVDQHTGYLVTAKHVFSDPQENWHPSQLNLRFAWQEEKSVFDEFGVTLTLRDSTGADLWTSPSDGSDLAAIAPPSAIGSTNPEAVFPDTFANDEDLFMGATVIVLGYPGVVGNQYLVRPIVRQGIVAWTNPIDPMNNVFMIDANVYPGNSGSPVFHVPTGLTRAGAFSLGGKIAFLGILSKGPIQNEPVTADGQPVSFQSPGQILPSNHQLNVQIQGIGGIGIIEPASKVLALVRSLQAKN
jgi:S1-C subfamily serine protease